MQDLSYARRRWHTKPTVRLELVRMPTRFEMKVYCSTLACDRHTERDPLVTHLSTPEYILEPYVWVWDAEDFADKCRT
ncbi:hypothetical protein SCLCIDRAFT_480462 [Scleroderma citrinum Foug A]|uniref:Uncharacterized protein n=1 Tax=Scleroderma citrinum Foug A TaxID=1036808 RepID=A0A0C2ZJM4_9AGAM|nr:hypothetical protein SCLCIDRAFT_480462 [Scleroderma citrinum Foug A]